VAGISVHLPSIWMAIAVKLALLALFPAALFVLRLLTPDETTWLRNAVALVGTRFRMGDAA